MHGASLRTCTTSPPPNAEVVYYRFSFRGFSPCRLVSNTDKIYLNGACGGKDDRTFGLLPGNKEPILYWEAKSCSSVTVTVTSYPVRVSEEQQKKSQKA